MPPIRDHHDPAFEEENEFVDDDDMPQLVEPPSNMTYTFFAEMTPLSFSHDPSSSLSPFPPSSSSSFPPSTDLSLVPYPPDEEQEQDFEYPKRSSHGKRRDASYIPRPPNAFILFRSSFIREQQVTGKVEGNHSNLSKIIGMYWKALPPSERSSWEAKARQAQLEHRRRYPDWRFRPGTNASATAKMPRTRKKRVGVGGAKEPPDDPGEEGEDKDKDKDSEEDDAEGDEDSEYEEPKPKRGRGKGKATPRAPKNRGGRARKRGFGQRMTMGEEDAEKEEPRTKEREQERIAKIAGLLVQGKKGVELEEAVERWERGEVSSPSGSSDDADTEKGKSNSKTQLLALTTWDHEESSRSSLRSLASALRPRDTDDAGSSNTTTDWEHGEPSRHDITARARGAIPWASTPSLSSVTHDGAANPNPLAHGETTTHGRDANPWTSTSSLSSLSSSSLPKPPHPPQPLIITVARAPPSPSSSPHTPSSFSFSRSSPGPAYPTPTPPLSPEMAQSTQQQQGHGQGVKRSLSAPAPERVGGRRGARGVPVSSVSLPLPLRNEGGYVGEGVGRKKHRSSMSVSVPGPGSGSAQNDDSGNRAMQMQMQRRDTVSFPLTLTRTRSYAGPGSPGSNAQGQGQGQGHLQRRQSLAVPNTYAAEAQHLGSLISSAREEEYVSSPTSVPLNYYYSLPSEMTATWRQGGWWPSHSQSQVTATSTASGSRSGANQEEGYEPAREGSFEQEGQYEYPLGYSTGERGYVGVYGGLGRGYLEHFPHAPPEITEDRYVPQPQTQANEDDNGQQQWPQQVQADAQTGGQVFHPLPPSSFSSLMGWDGRCADGSSSSSSLSNSGAAGGSGGGGGGPGVGVGQWYGWGAMQDVGLGGGGEDGPWERGLGPGGGGVWTQ
ncbi:hypothetical protein DXG01_007024 [Tephrocybe rancida]|nr:hypothetical protein DXG01_007024 [Tephrocybe rancida]